MTAFACDSAQHAHTNVHTRGCTATSAGANTPVGRCTFRNDCAVESSRVCTAVHTRVSLCRRDTRRVAYLPRSPPPIPPRRTPAIPLVPPAPRYRDRFPGPYAEPASKSLQICILRLEALRAKIISAAVCIQVE